MTTGGQLDGLLPLLFFQIKIIIVILAQAQLTYIGNAIKHISSRTTVNHLTHPKLHFFSLDQNI